MSEGLTGAAGCGPASVSYDFYLDGYGGALAAEAFAEAVPAAVRCVCGLTGRREPDPRWTRATRGLATPIWTIPGGTAPLP